jgi:serine protease Do
LSLEGQEKRSGSSGKGYLGVSIQDVTSKTQKKFNLPGDEGAVVTDVVDDSPADKAGVREDDVVLSFGGKAVYDADDLSRFVERTAPDSKSEVVVWRDGGKKTLTVTVGKKKRSNTFFSGIRGPDGNVLVWGGGPTLGLQVSTLNEQLGKYFGVPDNEGVLIESVRKESPGEKAGLQAGDVITRIGKERVAKHADLLRALSDYDEGDKVELETYRKGSKRMVTVEVVASEEDDGHGFFFQDFGNDGNVIVAPRFRMRMMPHPDVDIQLRKFNDDALRDAQRELKESLKGLRDKDIRINTVPRIERLPRVITL